MPLSNQQIEQRFGNHAAALETPSNPEEHQKLRDIWKDFAKYLDVTLEDGRTKSLMFTELESASMWSHKALAETCAKKNSGYSQEGQSNA